MQKVTRPSLLAYQSLGGWCSDIEAAALQEEARDKSVLEIGVWKGRSTVAMAATARSILSIDHFYGDGYAGRSNPRHEAVETLAPFQEIVTLCIGDWKGVRRVINPRLFDFIYYDADHTYEATKDFLDWCHFNKVNAVIGIHDVDNNPSHEGVKRALHEYTTNYILHDRLAIIK